MQIKKKKDKINFMLQNSHYRKLHFYLYLLTVFLISFIYFLFLFIFSSNSDFFWVISLISFLIGIYLIFNREKLVLKISDFIEKRKRIALKKENKKGFQKSLNSISKNKKHQTSLEKNQFKIKDYLKIKKKSDDKYIEIK